MREEEAELGQRRDKVLQQRARGVDREGALRDARGRRLLGGAQRQPEDGAGEWLARRRLAAEDVVRRKRVGKLGGEALGAEVDDLARVVRRRVGQVRAVRVEDDEELAREEGRQVGRVVAAVEADAEAAGLRAALALRLPRRADVLDRLEVGVREDGVVVRHDRRALVARSARARETRAAVLAQVEQHAEAARTGVVDILHRLLQQRALG